MSDAPVLRPPCQRGLAPHNLGSPAKPKALLGRGRARKRSEGCPRLGVPSGVDFARTSRGGYDPPAKPSPGGRWHRRHSGPPQKPSGAGFVGRGRLPLSGGDGRRPEGVGTSSGMGESRHLRRDEGYVTYEDEARRVVAPYAQVFGPLARGALRCAQRTSQTKWGPQHDPT